MNTECWIMAISKGYTIWVDRRMAQRQIQVIENGLAWGLGGGFNVILYIIILYNLHIILFMH